MTEEIKKYKLYYLQSKYNNIIKIINDIEEHYNTLISNNLIDNQNNFSNILYDIIKNLNLHYNNSINHYLENTDTDIDELIKNTNNIDPNGHINNNIMLKILEEYSNNISNDIFKDTINEINNLIKQFGYKDLTSMMKYLFKLNYFDENINNYINELNDITIPIGYNIVNNNSNYNNNYYWKVPSKFDNYDILNKKRELWIKLENTSSTNNNYICIFVYFKIDKFLCKSKTCQIKSPILYKKKTHIISKLNSIDTKFLKSFLRHDYLGNIYCLSEIEYNDYIMKIYKKYTKLVELTFVNIMKEFVNQEHIKNMFDIIFLLLLGTDETIEIASLLIGLVKEKKQAKNINIFDIMYENMTYYIQSKIKKSNVNIKNAFDKIKSINIDDIDYKKQLIINKNIPINVKSMVSEKIEEMKSSNNEYYKQLLYVKTILNFPWSSANDDLYFESLKNNKTKSIEYLSNIETNLNNYCYGHNEAKKLLIQMIGKWISNPKSIGTSFGMVGPPGVGKTLLAKSIGKALDIPFAQITLGGQNDGEILHGHGYTYSGSQPGMIIKKMVEMGKSRCILYFDELDKTCTKHGTINEITSILIHLTDPNMNKSFQDRFFQGIDFPLDKVIMIFSYNDSSKIDPILLDRLKEIKVSPYTIEDKVSICQKHIIQEMAENVNMEDLVNIDEATIRYLIDNYTNEAGVRDIKRKIEDIYMYLNIEKIYKKGLFNTSKNKKIKTINLSREKIIEILKEPDVHRRVINTTNDVGIINGLYATSTGDGGITPIQIYPNTQHSKDKYEVRLTGKQGDTMKESVLCSLTTAIEWLKHSEYKHDMDKLMNSNVKNGFHVHTPDGATPKDGPSAGCAFTCAFISRILNRPIKSNIAMTGEIELTGKISKIGGLEFKLQGAKKAGIKNVYVPYENKHDIEEIKKKYIYLIDDNFSIKLVNHINEIINEILI
jgi:endopeptidase La